MLLSVSASAGELLLQASPPQYVLEAFRRLLASAYDGHHVVLLSPSYCRGVEQRPEFSSVEKAIARRLSNKYADHGGLVKQVAVYATIVAQGWEPSCVPSGWEVPLQWVADNLKSKTHLLCEDLNDVEIYKAAAQDHLQANGLRSFEVQAFPLQGGGGNTHRVLASTAVDEKIFCICVVDSDKKSPTSAPGTTATACLGVTGSGVFQVLITKGRTIENSLPWRLIDKVRHDSSTALADSERKYAETSKYCNFKRGIRGYDLVSLPSSCSMYWRNAGLAIRGPIKCCVGECTADSFGDCKYIAHAGFGNGLLREAASWLRRNDRFGRLNEYLPSPNDQDWRDVGERVASYTLGQAPKKY